MWAEDEQVQGGQKALYKMLLWEWKYPLLEHV